MEVTKELLTDMYRVMVRIRTFEERVKVEYEAGRIPGFVHLYVGQEAVAAGSCATLLPQDYITSTHRGHGHLIARGGRTDLMMAELFGKKSGYCKGKGGSLHISDIKLGMLGANGIVAAGITIAVGAGLATQIKGTEQVAISFFGDGATNNARFHEGLNMAAVWNLPVVFVLENNLYGNATALSHVCKLTNLADRACAYGIPSKITDGNDVLAVYESVLEAVTRARSGEGPTLIECKTYRHYGHYLGDNLAYRTVEEVEEWKKRDPIIRFKKHLLSIGYLSEEDAHIVEHKMDEEIEKAIKFAVDSPLPEPQEVLTDVYA
ncbi:thiamine pyrophosphate-dependent dehydrogenase E1 component subunit alpha [Chloroflexota bacterium]